MIDEKKLIEDIDNCVVGLTNIQMMQIADIIETQPKVGEWIPCNERLPDKNGKYLCFIDLRYCSYMHVFNFAKDLYKVDKYDFEEKEGSGFYEHDLEYGYSKVENVVAWMPLPEPYKGVD